jgi:hypothetical protein
MGCCGLWTAVWCPDLLVNFADEGGTLLAWPIQSSWVNEPVIHYCDTVKPVYTGSGGAAGDLVVCRWELRIRFLRGEDPASFQPRHGDAQSEDGHIASSPPSQALRRSGGERQRQLRVKTPRRAVNCMRGYYGVTWCCIINTHLNVNTVTECCIVQNHTSS